MTELPYRERLRLKALDIATSIVKQDGLAALQARRVAREADCSIGTLYNVFGDMDGLVIALNQTTVRRLGEDLVRSFNAEQGSAVEGRLTDLALTYMRFAHDNRPLWRAVFEHRLPEGADIPETYRADQARLLALIESIVADDLADTDLRHRAARALFAAIHGIVQLALDQKLSGFDREATEAEIRFVVSAVANGLARARV